MNLYYFKYIYLSDNAALIIHVYQIKIVSIKSSHRHEISKSEFQFKKEKKYLNQRGVCILFCQQRGYYKNKYGANQSPSLKSTTLPILCINTLIELIRFLFISPFYSPLLIDNLTTFKSPNFD